MVDWSELRGAYQARTERIERRQRELQEWAEAAALYAVWAEAALTDVLIKVYAELNRCARDFELAPGQGFTVVPPRLVPWPDGNNLRVVGLAQGPHSVHLYGQYCRGQLPAVHLLRLRQLRARPDAVTSLAGVWLARDEHGGVSLRGYDSDAQVLSVEEFAERAIRLFVSGLS
jgi:hypothetical protein